MSERVHFIEQGGESAPVLPGDRIRIYLPDGPRDVVVGDVKRDDPDWGGWLITPNNDEAAPHASA